MLKLYGETEFIEPLDGGGGGGSPVNPEDGYSDITNDGLQTDIFYGSPASPIFNVTPVFQPTFETSPYNTPMPTLNDEVGVINPFTQQQLEQNVNMFLAENNSPTPPPSVLGGVSNIVATNAPPVYSGDLGAEASVLNTGLVSTVNYKKYFGYILALIALLIIAYQFFKKQK